MPSFFARNVGLLFALLLLTQWSVQINGQTSGCSPSCENGGICELDQYSNSYVCNCDGTGYSGVSCSVSGGSSTPASTNSTSTPASTNSTSTPSPTNSTSTPTSNNSTASSPTVNSTADANNSSCPIDCVHGDCVQDDSATTYYCDCDSGYSGLSCNVTSSAAAPSTDDAVSPAHTPVLIAPTANASCPVNCSADHGTCVQDHNADTYYCECETGYSGADCSQQSSSNTTTPSTTTNSTSPSTTPAATTNSTSSPDPSPPPPTKAVEAPNMCADCVHGTCEKQDDSTEYYCKCEDNYTGTSCNETTSASSNNTSSSSGKNWLENYTHMSGGKIFGIVIGVLIGVALIVTAGVMLYKRRRSSGPRSPAFVRYDEQL